MRPTIIEMRAFEQLIATKRQIKDIKRILSNDRFTTCDCGCKFMPFKSVDSVVDCPKCGLDIEVE